MGQGRENQGMEEQDTEKKSRTKVKQEAEELQRLGERLIDLSLEQIKSMKIPDTLKKEVIFAKTITRNVARRRQLQYIGSIMRTIDPAAIVEAIDRLSMARALASSKFKQMEKIRDDLLNGDNSQIETFLNDHPRADRQKLRQFVRNANQEIAAKKTPKSSRLLFKYIREMIESQDD